MASNNGHMSKEIPELNEQHPKTFWTTVERPGYFGKSREEQEKEWNQKYGKSGWRIAWETPEGEILTFDDIILEYILGYVEYFRQHPDEATYLTGNFSFGYDKELITREQAFDPYALYQKPGKANQFHHVAMNIALENILHLPFQGKEPIKIRAGKPGTPVETWPAGWRWQPGLIPCVHPELIAEVDFPNRWWEKGSIEDLYQSDKVLRVIASPPKLP